MAAHDAGDDTTGVAPAIPTAGTEPVLAAPTSTQPAARPPTTPDSPAEPAQGPADFFLSYAAADQVWAEWVGAELEHAGRRVTMQAWDLFAGIDTSVWVSEQIAAARRIVALLSEAYVSQGSWTREWSASLDDDRLLPLVVGDCQPPVALRRLHMERLYDVDETTARERLLRAARLEPVPRVAAAGFPGRGDPDGDASGPAAGAAPAPRAAAARGSGGAADLRYGEDARPTDAARSAGARFPARPPASWNVPARYRWFVGRDAVLAAVRAGFQADAADVATQVVQGMGGAGKTQFAVEYAHRFATDYTLVWWVAAESAETIAKSFDALATELGLPDDADLTGRGRRALRTLRDHPGWLLIFDSLDDPADLTGWRPSGRGHLLVTSRGRAAGELGELVELGDLTDQEATLVLRRRAPHLSDRDASRIAEWLGYLPLAVDQAAGYLAVVGTDADTYLRLLRRGIGRAMPRSTLSYPLGVCGSVTTAADRLRAMDPVAHDVLTTAAFLAPDPLPHTLLVPLAGAEADATDLVPHLYALDRFALARVAGGAIRLHRFTQAVLRDGMSAAETAGAIARAGDLIAAAPAGDPDNPESWPLLGLLAGHIDALLDQVDAATAKTARRGAAPDRGADGSDRATARVYADERARQLAAAARVVLTPELVAGAGRAGTAGVPAPASHDRPPSGSSELANGPGSDRSPADPGGSRLRDVLLAVGWYRERRGQLPSALRMSRWQVVLWRTVLGPDSPGTLRAARLCAAVAHDAGAHDESYRLYRDTFDRWRGLARGGSPAGGPHVDATRDPGAAVTSPRRGSDAGQPAGAAPPGSTEPAGRDGSGMIEIPPGEPFASLAGLSTPDRREALLAGNGVATGLRDQGRRTAARDLRRSALAAAVEAFGDGDPLTLRLAASLALDLYGLDDVQEAYELDERTLRARRAVLGDDHPDTLASEFQVARDLRALGQAVQARDVHSDVYEHARGVLGDDHPDTLRYGNELAVDRYRLGDYAGARELHTEILHRSTAALGEDHPFTIRTASGLGLDLVRLGEPDEALRLHEAAHALAAEILGSDHPDTLHLAHNLARDLVALGRVTEAIARFEDTLARRTRVLGAAHTETRRTARRLAELAAPPDPND
jgi:tetratricopeptide (TPR) repeat protein